MSAIPVTFVPCTRKYKCSRCGKAGMCSRTSDGAYELCYRVNTGDGFEKEGRLGIYWVYRSDGAPVRGTKIEHDLGGGELAKPDELGNVYRELLYELNLGEGHRGQLQARGLTDDQISRYGFRSWPDPTRVATIADKLYRKHGELCAKIPGWVVRDGRPWMAGWPGILIPIWDMANNIVAIHVRRDITEDDDGPRYVWLSSTRFNGPSPGTPPFFCFPKGMFKVGDQPEFPEVWLVEGEFKAIACSERTGKPAISIPGVSLYKSALPLLESSKARRIWLAFDADWADNKFVAMAILRTWQDLREKGYEVTVATWPLNGGKGIDDLFHAGHNPTLLHDRETWPFLSKVAKATGHYENGVTSKKTLPRIVPSVSPNRAKEHLQCFVPGQHSPFDPELMDAYILAERTEPILRNGIRDAIKRKMSRIKDWDDALAERKKLLDQFQLWDRIQRDKSDPEKRQPLDQMFPDAPLPMGYRVPAAYQVDGNGVHRLDLAKEDSDPETICLVPAFPTARLQDIVQDSHSLRLSWWRDGGWKHKVFSQTQLASAREIVLLADNDFPVDSENALNIIRYIRDMREANMDVLPRVQVSSHLGWQGRDGEHGFLVGLQRARPDGTLESTRQMDLMPPGKWASDQLVFKGLDKGDDQVVFAYRSEGTLAAWMQAIEPIIHYPRVLLMLYASFAAPLLDILKAPPFTVDLSYTTSAGKTTALRVAASVWGTPDERDPTPVIRTWENTRVFVERSLALCNGLPLILDDTARANKPEFIAKVVYDVSAGSGKGRGSQKGIASGSSWRTIMLSTGEQKITNFAELGGGHARAVCLWGPPFNEQNASTGQVVARMHRGLLANHGHAGPKWVSWILSQRDKWDMWREHYRAIHESYSAQAGDNAVANRFSEYFAVLMLASILVHEAIEFPWPAPNDPFKDLRQDILREAKEADRARLARELILGWVASQPQAFWNKKNASFDGDPRPQQPPNGGWLGRWDFDPDMAIDRERRHPHVAIYPHHLKAKLEQAGFPYETTLRTWRDRGWLEVEEDRMVRLVRVDRVRSRMVCLRTIMPDEAAA